MAWAVTACVVPLRMAIYLCSGTIAYPATSEQDPATDVTVNRIHDTVIPEATAGTGINAYVTGPNAGNVSFASLIGQRLPWLIVVVVALSMILLLVIFRVTPTTPHRWHAGSPAPRG
jgi:uncharacterized membrane protein YdfJ with MMPL/SSD domain